MVNSRNKGKVGEREAAKAISECLGCTMRRGQQYSGVEGQDIVGMCGVHWEVKRVEKLNLANALQQAIRDAGDNVPAIIHRASQQPWIVSLRLVDVMRFIDAVRQS